jgi:hypothetical protein
MARGCYGPTNQKNKRGRRPREGRHPPLLLFGVVEECNVNIPGRDVLFNFDHSENTMGTDRGSPLVTPAYGGAARSFRTLRNSLPCTQKTICPETAMWRGDLGCPASTRPSEGARRGGT